ncbi:MAG: METTL5 family protein [archaeon]
MRLSRSGLAIELSKLQGFSSPSVKSEQYATDSEIAADVLWHAFELGDIDGKRILDLGCGPGSLGIGASFLGASSVVMVDIDSSAISDATSNLAQADPDKKLPITVKEADVTTLESEVDTVIQNPPFGTKQRHADKAFLKTAIRCAPVIYSIHKATTRGFLDAFATSNGYQITHAWQYSLPLKNTQSWHKKKVFYAEIICVRMIKEK